MTTGPSPTARWKLAVAGWTGDASRLIGRGGGTALPGKVLLRLAPRAVEDLTERLVGTSVLISATNGKTTTARMLGSILRADGRSYIHNRAGANMPSGVASELLAAVREGDGVADRGRLGLFEVDEAWLPDLAARQRPGVVVLGNLFRDQLDRYGELELLAEAWRETIESLPADTRIVLNADDPLVADLGISHSGVIYFGVEDASVGEREMRHASDSKYCRRCGEPYVYSLILLGHLGHYTCPGCQARRPLPRVFARKVRLNGMTGSALSIATPEGPLELDLPLPGLYNVYNALAATAAAVALDVPLDAIAAGLGAADAPFGRVETLSIGGTAVSLLLIKNPIGANEVMRTLILDDRPVRVWAALNDGIADGRDVSWIWDADFEILAPRIEHVTCSGARADELALRLKYAGVPVDRIAVDRAIDRSFFAAVAAAEERGRLIALPTYTALLDLRARLVKRGLAERHLSR